MSDLQSPEAAFALPRSSIRQSILSSFQIVVPVHEDPTHRPASGIKVVPYVNVRQVLGIACLIIWPIILGTAFNICGFEEASAYLKIRLDVEQYQQRVEHVQDVLDNLVAAQNTILVSLLANDGKGAQVAAAFGQTATTDLKNLDALYPELSEYHKRVTPKKILNELNAWIAGVKNFNTVDPTDLVDNLSGVIKGVRMFFSAFHATSLRGGDTWNNVLQQLFISEVTYRLKEVASFGHFAYETILTGSTMNQNLRRTLIRRYQRSLMALDMYYKYSLPQFQISNLQKTCTGCNWTYLHMQKAPFWRGVLSQIVTLDNTASLHTIITKADLPDDVNASSAYVTLLNESLYPIEKAQSECRSAVTDNFQNELNAGAAVFGVILVILISWLILTTNLIGLVAQSLAGIFSESYRFQWVQLCRRRAIEREKSRSDKIVAEMFFEINFKYLYEGNLPPTVLYKDATIAFVELLQYEQLCKIYTTVDHVAILDWYYHLVSTAVKGFNTNVVATAGHYCLLAGTHAYHAENVALSMLRLMTLVRESYLPLPHNSKLPLIRAGIHTGPVAGAIVSLKFPLFTMLGDTVNTAARMNSKSKPYCILLSETTHEIVLANFRTQNAGVFNVKGKGQMNTYWLLSCKWRAFVGHFVDLELADELRKVHDLNEGTNKTPMTYRRKTGFDHCYAHSVFEGETGRRRSSSINDDSVAGLGGDMLQTYIRNKNRKKSRRIHRLQSAKRKSPNERSGRATYEVVEKGAQTVVTEAVDSMPYCERTDFSKAKSVKLSARIDVKVSPHESYYIQVANSINMRSWKMHQH